MKKAMSIEHSGACAIVVLCLALSLSPAHASEQTVAPGIPTSLSFEAPVSWGLLPGKSNKITQTATQTAYFGEENTLASALAYGHAGRGALYLTWVDTTAAHPSPEGAIRIAFDNLHEAPFLATSDSGSTQEILYRERNFEGVAEMTFEWAHLNNNTLNVVRTLGWKDADGRLHLAIAECVLSTENADEYRPLCDSSLAGLHLTAVAKHTPLRSLAAPKSFSNALQAEDIQVPKLETGKAEPGSTIGAAPKKMGEVLYNGRPPPPSKDKSNRFLIAIGILLLGAAFFLTTRSKDKDSAPSDEDDSRDEENDNHEEDPEEKAE